MLPWKFMIRDVTRLLKYKKNRKKKLKIFKISLSYQKYIFQNF